MGGGKFGKVVSRKMEKHRLGNGEWSDKEGWREADGILEGVSSLHSWIKKQTVISPTTKMTYLKHVYSDLRKMFLLS